MEQKRKNPFLRSLVSPLSLLIVLSAYSPLWSPAAAQAGNPPPAKEQPKAPAAKEQPKPPVGKEQQRPALAPPRTSSAAGELDQVSDSAEQIFDLAVDGRIERIGRKLEMLKKTVATLNFPQNQSDSILLPRLGHTIVDLEQAWNAKDRLDTMRYANRITLIAATLAVPFKPNVPTEVSLLDYNCRELAIWSEAKKPEKLSNIVMRMHLAWQTLMPKLIEYDGIRELRRFSEIMGRLEVARTPDDYGRLSRQVSAEIDAMKAIFAKPSK